MDANELMLKKVLIGLSTLGAAYHIRLDDGQEFRSEKPLGEPEKKKRRFVDPNRIKNGPYLNERLADMGVGECRTVPMQEGDTFQRFRANTSAWYANHFRPADAECDAGEGHYYSVEANTEDQTVTVYRFV